MEHSFLKELLAKSAKTLHFPALSPSVRAMRKKMKNTGFPQTASADYVLKVTTNLMFPQMFCRTVRKF
jgi:hypothetical protein